MKPFAAFFVRQPLCGASASQLRNILMGARSTLSVASAFFLNRRVRREPQRTRRIRPGAGYVSSQRAQRALASSAVSLPFGVCFFVTTEFAVNRKERGEYGRVRNLSGQGHRGTIVLQRSALVSDPAASRRSGDRQSGLWLGRETGHRASLRRTRVALRRG